MNKYLISVPVFFIFTIALSAQKKIDEVIIQIEKNNTTLSALRKSVDAQKVGNKTAIFLQNPEIEFNYFWGNPVSFGNRIDFSIKQKFDFPTAYGFENQISDIKNLQAELEYRKELKSVLMQARNVCVDLIYVNALMSEYKKRTDHALNIAKSYQLKFDAGDVSVLEFNKAQMNLANTINKMELFEIERAALISKLTGLNGNIAIDLDETEFQTFVISSDFNQWFALAEQSNPMLNWLKNEIEVNKKQVSLSRALSLPKFQAGYMSETVVGQQFRGVSVGMSIPLWENKNAVKFAKANGVALEAVVADNTNQLYSELKTLHNKAVRLQSNLTEYKAKLQLFNSSELLQKALDTGEISLVDYFIELADYYEGVNNVLQLNKDLNKVVVELNQYTQ